MLGRRLFPICTLLLKISSRFLGDTYTIDLQWFSRLYPQPASLIQTAPLHIHPTSCSTFQSYSTDTPNSMCLNLNPTAHKTRTAQQPFPPQIMPSCQRLRTESLVMLDSSFSPIKHLVHKQIPWLFKIHPECEQIIVHSYNGILAMRRKTTSHPTNNRKSPTVLFNNSDESQM